MPDGEVTAGSRFMALADQAGLREPQLQTHEGTVRFHSLEALLGTERACVWTLGGLLDEAQFAQLRGHARPVFGPFTDPDGSVHFPIPALILSARR